MEYNIYLVNSFTTENFKGNPAGIIPDARHLSDNQMQEIARELNVAETAFISSISGNKYKMRFFSPSREINHCGHSTLAAFYVLTLRGYISPIESGRETVYMVCKDEKVEVDIYFYDYEIQNIVLKLGSPREDGKVKASEELLQGLKLELRDLKLNLSFKDLQIVDFGARYIFIPIREKEKLENISINKEKLSLYLEEHNLEGIHFYYLPGEDSQYVYARGFSTKNNLYESPASVGQNGSLIYLLAKEKLIDSHKITVIQGETMGRKSKLFCEIKEVDGQYKVEISGKGKIVLEGVINIE